MKQFVVIGLGRFGSSVARTLYSMNHDVLAIDKDEEMVQEISDYVTHAVQADATDESVLKALGIRNFDVAVVAIASQLHASILISLLCKEVGVKHVIAKVQNELHAKVLYKIGVDKVVFPERDMGMRVAHNLVSSNILDYIEVAPNYSLVEVEAMTKWIGYSLRDLNVREKYGVNILAIRRGKEINVSPKGDDIINAGDILVAIGSNKDIAYLERQNQ